MKITSRVMVNTLGYGMSREDFMKAKFKAYQTIEFKHTQMQDPVEVILVAVNYDTEILTLRQCPPSTYFEEDDFHAHISQCKIARPKLKVAKPQ